MLVKNNTNNEEYPFIVDGNYFEDITGNGDYLFVNKKTNNQAVISLIEFVDFEGNIWKGKIRYNSKNGKLYLVITEPKKYESQTFEIKPQDIYIDNSCKENECYLVSIYEVLKRNGLIE